MPTDDDVDTTGAAEKALLAQGVLPASVDTNVDTKGAEPPKDKGNTVPAPVVDAATVAADKVITDKAAAETAAAAALVAKEASDKAAIELAGPLKDFTVYENPAAQAAVNLLKTEGLGPNEANAFFAEALKTNDITKVDVAGLEKRLGKDKATLVMAGVTAHYNELVAQSNQTVKQTHDIFNGEENWNTVRAWAQTAEKTDAKLKAKVDDIRAMLNEGGTRAEAGARELLRVYGADPSTKGLGNAKLVVGTSNGNVIGTALTRGDYLKELTAAHSRNAKPAEIAAIDARRIAGRTQGI